MFSFTGMVSHRFPNWLYFSRAQIWFFSTPDVFSFYCTFWTPFLAPLLPPPPFFYWKKWRKKNQYFCNIFGHLSSVILKKIINYLYFLDITVVWFCLGDVLNTYFFNIFGHHSSVILTKYHKLSVFFGHHTIVFLPFATS